MIIDPMYVYQAIVDASGPQVLNTPEGRHLLALGCGQELRVLIDKIARNAAGVIAMEINERLE